jgi:hypothetical protein
MQNIRYIDLSQEKIYRIEIIIKEKLMKKNLNIEQLTIFSKAYLQQFLSCVTEYFHRTTIYKKFD